MSFFSRKHSNKGLLHQIPSVLCLFDAGIGKHAAGITRERRHDRAARRPGANFGSQSWIQTTW